MKRTIYLTIVLLIGTIGMPGCDDCKCAKIKGGYVDKYLDIDGLSSFIVRKTVSVSGPNTFKANDQVGWSEIAHFSLSYTTRTYGHRLAPRNRTGQWGSVAYACDCTPPLLSGYLGTQEKLKYITVRTVFNFDSDHPAGSIINGLTALAGNPGSSATPLNEYLSKGLIPYREKNSFQLVISRTPSAKGPFALDITVELDNGEVYTNRTPIIELI